jgi:hypothetical protein
MHTETNLWEGPKGTEAVDWLWKQWANVLRVRNVGIPMLGFTWYSLTDQVDWDTALRENNGHVNPLGLYDLHRNIRPVGRAYQTIIREWSNVLPAQSQALVLPVDHPGDQGALGLRGAPTPRAWRRGRWGRGRACRQVALPRRPAASVAGDLEALPSISVTTPVSSFSKTSPASPATKPSLLP